MSDETSTMAIRGPAAGTVSAEGAARMEAEAYMDGLPRGITSSSLLAMLQLRLQGQDQAIALYADGIKANTDKADAVLGIMQELLALKDEAEGGGGAATAYAHPDSVAAGDAVEAAAIANGDDEAYAEEDGDDAARAHFGDYIEDLTRRAAELGITLTIGGSGPITTASLATNVDVVKQELAKINSGSEMEMIRLQDVMQQRSSGVQLFTNLLKQLSDSQMAVIRNISG